MTPDALSASRRLPTSRFAAALCLSALAHLAMPLWVSGGGARTSSDSTPILPTLSVRVMPQVEAPVVEPVAPPAAVEAQAPVPRVERAQREPVARAAAPEPQPQPPRAAGGVPEAPDFTYYPAKQLDIYPKLLGELDLKYRGKAADDGVTGRALLLVLIDEVGTVKDVSVVEAEPPNLFEEDAQRAFMGARFAPAVRNGRAVRSRVLIAVNYGVERGSP